MTQTIFEAVLFCGIQATGKTTFYEKKFKETHLRLSLDMLKTRHRENILLDACLQAKQPFVIDNTNPTVVERRVYIEKAREAGFRVTGYYFRSNIEDALSRNKNRPKEERIPEAGIRGAHSRLEIPSKAEGFDRLYYVAINNQGEFVVQDWRVNEV